MRELKSTIKQKLTLMQLSDSFFPSGSYTLSHGLESLIQKEQIKNPEDLKVFLRLLLHNKIGTSDLVALMHGHWGSANQNIEEIKRADRYLFAQTAIAINRQAQRQSGRALLMVAESTWQAEQLAILTKETFGNCFHCLHPVVFGVVGNVASLSLTDTSLAFLHSFLAGLLGAAIRLGILGHLQAQQISLELASDLEIALHTALSLNIEEMWSCTPTIDIAQMGHSQLNSRLFAN